MANASDIERLSPEKLVAGFARTRISTFLLLAIAVHVVVIALTSISYIRSQLTIGPEQPAAADEKAADQAKSKKPTTTTAAAARKLKPATSAPAASGNQKTELEKRKEAPVVREITKMPKKGEIPKQPDDLGVSIEETNP